MSQKVTINHTNLAVSKINLGGNVFGWTLDEQQSFEILDAFAGAGYNFIDTADMYSYWVDGKAGGQSETIIGKWQKTRNNRNNIVIATKVGGPTGEHGIDVSKSHILKSVDASLKRLQTDYIDIYYTHYDDNVTPLEDMLSAYDEIIKAGKVRYIGASNISPDRLTRSFELAAQNNLPKYVALQPHYNLVERELYSTEYLPLVEKYGLSVFPYWALAAGFLTGKYRSEADLGKSVRGEGVKQYLNVRGFAVLDALDAVSEKHNVTPASVAIAWLLHQPNVAAPIASATSKSQLDTLFAATQLTLDAEDLTRLDVIH